MRSSGNVWTSGRMARTATLLGLATLAALALAAPAAAAPPVLWQTEAGEIGTARGIAADPDTGHIFVSDQTGKRIVKLDAWGQVLRTWGWDVVESGPGDDTTAPEDQFEICVPAAGDVCKGGIEGIAGAGQFNSAAGIAIDSAGNVYVAETASPRRVQKFDPEGHFLLSFGGEVNKTTGADVCTAADIEGGDVCGAGTTGTGPSEFSNAAAFALRTVIAIAPGDKVYVGDVDRIQLFNASGEYQTEIAVPGETIQSLAADAAGFLYAAYEVLPPPLFARLDAKPNVRKLDPLSGAELLSFAANNPKAIAVDQGNGEVYVFDKDFDEISARIRRFDPAAKELEAFGEGLNRESTGLALSAACGVDGVDVYHSNNSPGFVRAYGPPPDPSLCPRPLGAPVIANQYARSVGIVDASVAAEINPRFWEDTTYYVQYASAACLEGGWEAPCVQRALFPGATLTSQIVNSPVVATATLQGLEPATAYRFRFIATSSGGGPTIGAEEGFTTFPPNPPARTDCANQARRGGLAALLPDCRGYEMVSPVEKNNGDIRVGLNISSIEQIYPQASPDGAKLTYSSGTSFGGGAGAPFASQYIAQRGAGGWATENITPPRQANIPGGSAAFLNNQFVAFSEDLCAAWLFWDGDPPLGEAPAPGTPGYKNLYRRENCAPGAGTYTALTRSAPPTAPDGVGGDDDFNPVLQGLSADGSHAVYRANDALAVEAGTPAPKAGVAGKGSNGQLYELYEGDKVRLVSVLPGGAASPLQNTVGDFGNAQNAVSADGETIFWTASLGAGDPGTIYARLGGAETVQVSGGPFARFQAAAADGSALLYSEGANLRRYELASEAQSTIAPGFRGLVGASEDLARAYLVSSDATLDPEPDGTPTAGGENLYFYEAGAGFAFIGTLATGEGIYDSNSGLTISNAVLSRRVSRVSADGRHLAFLSRAPLTGYDNADAASGAADTEVFRYAAGSDELTCVSCNPSGARPAGAARGVLGRGNPIDWEDIAGLLPGHKGHFRVDRALAADGQRLFFESFDRLLPRDTNGNRDVYQWEAVGKGDCDTDNANPGPHYFAQNGGCIALISSGKGDGDADFIEATPSGEDVFFRTEQSLVEADPGLVDIYDARVGGGFDPPPPGAASCEGDACQAAARTPEFPSPASAAVGPEGGPPGSCRAKARRAKRLGAAAARARRAARNAGEGREARLRRRAGALTRRARRSSRAAKRCRARARRAANASGRAAR